MTLGCVLIALFAASAPAQAAPKFSSGGVVVFNFVEVGTTSGVKQALLRNSGDQPNRITGITLRGRDPGDFAIANDGCTGVTLNPGASCLVDVVFRPTKPGTRVSALYITDTTPCPNWIMLAGSGTKAKNNVRATAAACGIGPTITNVIVQAPSTTQGSANSVAQLPSTRQCTGSRRRFRIRLAAPYRTRLLRARVRVDGKLVRTQRLGGRLTALIDLRGLPKRAVTVKVSVRTTNGKLFSGQRTYQTCTPAIGGTTPRY